MLEKGARKPSALLYSPLVPGTCSSSSPLLQTISHGANPDVPTSLPQSTVRNKTQGGHRSGRRLGRTCVSTSHCPIRPCPHLIADGGVPVHHPLDVGVQAGPRGALGQGCSVGLLLALPDDGLAAQPLCHRVLVARPGLLVSLGHTGEKGWQRLALHSPKPVHICVNCSSWDTATPTLHSA